MGLTEKTCSPCRGDVPPLTRTEAEAYLAQTPGWELNADATRLERHFGFNNFVEALQFSQQVGRLAEQEGHHPDITFGWGYCQVLFYTHKINGLHQNDFIIAAKVNDLL